MGSLGFMVNNQPTLRQGHGWLIVVNHKPYNAGTHTGFMVLFLDYTLTPRVRWLTFGCHSNILHFILVSIVTGVFYPLTIDSVPYPQEDINWCFLYCLVYSVNYFLCLLITRKTKWVISLDSSLVLLLSTTTSVTALQDAYRG